MSGYERRSSGGEWVGLIIVLIGFWLLMRTMGIFPLFPFGWIIHRFWLPALFIGLGVLLLTRRQTRERGFLGSLLHSVRSFFPFRQHESVGIRVPEMDRPSDIDLAGCGVSHEGPALTA